MRNPFIQAQAEQEEAFSIGVITSLSGGLFVLMEGESAPRAKKFKRLSSYAPVVGDRVIIAKISGTYVVLGKVV